jgi:transposase
MKRDQRRANAYIFGAVCPKRDTGIALVMPKANADAMNRHLIEISKNVPVGVHAVIIIDGAGWHRTRKLEVPHNLSLMMLPPYSPELNPQENIWQYMRQNYLAGEIFDSYEHIVDACCSAWNALIAEAGRIAAIATRKWIERKGS